MRNGSEQSIGPATCPPAIAAWLGAFAAAVRSRDYARGRGLFTPDALGFGTVATRAEGLDAIVDRQWRRVWGVTRSFAFDAASVRTGGDERTVWVAAQWSSWGRDAAGTEFERRGRVTIVLVRDGDRWLASHTHFSLAPSVTEATPGSAKVGQTNGPAAPTNGTAAPGGAQ